MDRIEELEVSKPDIIITQKLDGIRAVARVINNKVEIFSLFSLILVAIL